MPSSPVLKRQFCAFQYLTLTPACPISAPPSPPSLPQVPQDPTQLQRNIYFCGGCSRYLLSTDFSLTANARSVGQCRRCMELDNEARRREDFSHYRTILHRLRKAEALASGDTAKITYLLQVGGTVGVCVGGLVCVR